MWLYARGPSLSKIFYNIWNLAKFPSHFKLNFQFHLQISFTFLRNFSQSSCVHVQLWMVQVGLDHVIYSFEYRASCQRPYLCTHVRYRNFTVSTCNLSRANQRHSNKYKYSPKSKYNYSSYNWQLQLVSTCILACVLDCANWKSGSENWGKNEKPRLASSKVWKL